MGQFVPWCPKREGIKFADVWTTWTFPQYNVKWNHWHTGFPYFRSVLNYDLALLYILHLYNKYTFYSLLEIKGIFVHPFLAERIISMLNYFLQHLVGPKMGALKVKDFSEFEFKPQQLVSDICTIYLNLGYVLKIWSRQNHLSLLETVFLFFCTVMKRTSVLQYLRMDGPTPLLSSHRQLEYLRKLTSRETWLLHLDFWQIK